MPLLGRLPFPSRRLALIVAVAGAASLLVDWPTGAVLVLGVLGGLFGVDARLAGAPASVTVTRRLPSVVPLFEERSVHWAVRNAGTRSVHVQLADEPDPSLHLERRRHELVLEPGEQEVLESPFRPRRRGDRVLHGITIRVVGPFGLAQRQVRHTRPEAVRVHPPARGRRLAAAQVALGVETGERSARTLGTGTEFDHLRDWQQGDEVRRIDWRATARVGTPVVRTFRAERNQRVVVMVDTGRAVAGLVEDVPRLDHLMDGALAIATLAGAMGDRFGLFAHADRTRLVMPPVRARDAPQRAADALYGLDAVLVESDHRSAVLEVLTRVQRRCLVVMLADLAQPAAGRELVPAVTALAARHLVLVGAVLDPALAGAATTSPDRPAEVYGAAAAVAGASGREDVARQLQRAGVRVLDRPPTLFPRALIDAYLDLRVSERL